jgi:methylglutaconyl-CoA hydratase
VQGNAFGGALGLLSVSDVVISADSARFGFTETRLGLIPATIGPYVLARIGNGASRRYFFSPRNFSVNEAKEIGLVSRSVPIEKLDQAIEEEVAPLLTAAPGAVAEAKGLLSMLSTANGDNHAVDISVDALAKRWESDEVDEGTQAFFEKRKPNWSPD